ncbi:MAG: DNA-binding transcriptional regulator [Planctomycetaceae bacterium]|jgi:LacI family transcriptional regulator|nr:DNA-binding transcriptional regulator [Planctomycetaceae bacterium]
MKRILLIVETSRSYGRDIMAGISRFALEHGDWSIYFDDRGLLEEPADWLRRWAGNGIISRTAIPSLQQILAKKRCPRVELHGDACTHPSEVRVCDQTLAEMAANYFIERGFQHFGFYSCNTTWWVHARSCAYEQTIVRRGFSCNIYSDYLDLPLVLHPVWENRFEKPLRKWLALLPKPVGIWVVTDHQAVRVLEGCRDLRLRVPEDVAILGTSNDTLLCNLTSPPLSSIDVNGITVGYEAARLLQRKMDGVEPAKVLAQPIEVLPFQVVTRQSTDVIAIPEPDVAAALALIREQACKRINVAKIVDELGISRRSLERYFMKYLNRSPHDEILRIRINQAKILLCATTLSIAAIARRTGFASRDYFISVFHRQAGVTPQLYRNTTLSSAVVPAQTFCAATSTSSGEPFSPR